MKIKLLFAKSYSIGGLLIRLGLFSDHNHVGIQVGEKVFDATLRHGVRANTLERFYADWNVKDELWISVPEPSAALAFLLDQRDKKYDWKAVVSLPFRRNWHNKERWMCSELAAEALLYGGIDFPMNSNRVTPRDLMFLVPSCARVIEKRSL